MRTLVGLALLLAMTGCGERRTPTASAPPPPKPKENLFVLLPDSGGRSTSITVTNKGGTQTISEPNQVVRVSSQTEAPHAAVPMDNAEVTRRFGAVRDALPLPPAQFVLNFIENRDELTPESKEMLPAILQAVRERRSTDISVVGHTDTTDSPEANYRLGLRRAERVATFLRENGVAAESLSVESHGESDLLIKTPDNVSEQKNRRAEVLVR